MARLKCRKRTARKTFSALQSSQVGCGNHWLNNYRTLRCHLCCHFFATASVRQQFEFHGIYGFELVFLHLLLRGRGSICSMCPPTRTAVVPAVQDPGGDHLFASSFPQHRGCWVAGAAGVHGAVGRVQAPSDLLDLLLVCYLLQLRLWAAGMC